MNEPFVGGVKDTVQSSHEANIHKKRVAYELDLEEEREKEMMDDDQHKANMEQDLIKKLKEDVENRN